MQGQTFNPREHLINIKNGKGVSEYLEVKWRLVWFRQECPEGTIETEIVHLDMDAEVEAETFAWNAEKRRSEKAVKTGKGRAIFRAVVTDGKGGRATGTKSENAANFPDFVEKAESGAIGRALAALGYGTQFAPELNEEHRIVDAPVERSQQPQTAQQEQRGNNGAASSSRQQQSSDASSSSTNNARRSPQPQIQTPPPAQSTPSADVPPSTEVLQEEVGRMNIVGKNGQRIQWRDVVAKALSIKPSDTETLNAALARHLTDEERRRIDTTIKPFRQTIAP